MSTRFNRPVLLTLFGVLLQGCSSTSRFDDHYGASVRANLSAQVINPAAAANAAPATGMDGGAARAVQERYQRSFKEPSAGNDRALVGGSSTQ